MTSLMMIFLAAGAAQATEYQVRFCLEWDIQFDDANDSTKDDFYNDNSVHEPARGVYVIVRESGNGPIEFQDFAGDSGTYKGCTDELALDSSTNYKVNVFSKSYVNDNYVYVYDDEDSPSLLADVVWAAWSPTSSGTETKQVPTADWTNMVAAASHTVWKHNGGQTGYDYILYEEGEDGSTAAVCDDHSESAGRSVTCGGEIWIAQGHQDNKYVIAHEVGHAMARYRDEGKGPNKDMDASQTSECTWNSGHAMVSVEYQSAAAVEGLAHYIAATSFNDTSAYGDCWFYYYKNVDWNGDGTADGIDWIDCEYNDHCDGVGESCTYIADEDHFGNECNASTTDNRGVEYDWLRFWWHMRTRQGVGFRDCMDIWDGADPKNWNKNDIGSGANDPAERLDWSASQEGFGTEWDDEAPNHGADR